MGYNKAKAKTVYQPMRSMTTFSPAMHEAFRREWEANFESAIEKAMQLAKQGFHVEECLQRGALMESRAKKLSKQLQERGYKVELIPIARWGREQAVFLVYKPPEKPVAPQPPKPKQTLKLMSADKIIDGFYRHFETSQDLSYFQTKGYAMDKQHTVALVDLSKDNSISEKGKNAKQSGFITRFYNDRIFRHALYRLEKQNKRYVSIDDNMKYPLSIEIFRKILRAIGDGPISTYAIGPGPVYFFNERATPDNIGIAGVPDLDNPQSPDVLTINHVIAFAEATLGYKRR